MDLVQIEQSIEAAISETELKLATVSHDAHPDREPTLREVVRLLKKSLDVLQLQILDEE